MLTDLFKPAWKSRSVEKRLKAISAMGGADPDKQKILAQLAADDEVSVCIAAIQKLTSAAVLHEISKSHSSDSVRTAAEQRLNELMAAGGSINEDQFRDLLSRYAELKPRIAACADMASVRADAIEDLTAKQLLEVLALTAYTDSRQLAAEKLTDIDALESARKMLRGKDKKTERILRTKIENTRTQQRQHAENLAKVDRLIEEIEYLASQKWRHDFKDRLMLNHNRWDKLDFDIAAEQKQRYQTAREIVDARYEQQKMVEQARQSQQQLVVDIEDYLLSIASTDLGRAIDSLPEILARRDQFETSWHKIAVKSPPEPAAYEQYSSMLGALQSATQLVQQSADILKADVRTQEDMDESAESGAPGQTVEIEKLAENSQQLEAVLKQFQWPAMYGELRTATELQLRLTDWRKALKASADEDKQKLDRLHKNISSIFRFSRAGNLRAAKQFCEKVEKALDQFDGKHRQALEERFEEARKTLGDMGDWKNFATEPKYIELCEAMETLAGSKHHADRLAQEIKTLQQKWKKLGHSDISEQYWPRFKQAADKAYQPCAEFFEQRKKLRQANLEQRQQYVEQMRKLFEETDWDNDPDYRAAQSSVRSISDHFAAIKEVEYKAGQKQWKQFSAFKDKVNARLDVIYDANIKLKQELISQTEALAGAPAREENLDRLKSLQTRWKQVGITRRKQDQQAWKEFKKQGDIVYSNVQQLRQAKRNETDQQLNAYRDIIKDIKKLAATASELTQADHQFAELQAKYANLPDLQSSASSGQLPEKLAEGIQRDYRHACDLFDECHSRIMNNKHAQQIEALRLKADLCAQLEALGESPSEQQLQQISQQWESIELHDPVLSHRIEQRRNSARAAVSRDEIAEQRRMLCIQLEIALGVETPAEDKDLRMQYQLEQMNKSGLGLQAMHNSEWLESIKLDWLCMPGAQPQQQIALDARFQRALQSKH